MEAIGIRELTAIAYEFNTLVEARGKGRYHKSKRLAMAKVDDLPSYDFYFMLNLRWLNMV